MKKLLLLLPMVLLLTTLPSCKDKTDEDEEFAKEYIGTYDYDRKGTILLINTATNDTLRTPHRSEGEATITYLGDTRIQLNMGGVIFTAKADDTRFLFDPYTESVNTDLLNITFSIDMVGTDYPYANPGLSIFETYSGTSLGPNTIYRTEGEGSITLRGKSASKR